MITERTLKKWRREALNDCNTMNELSQEELNASKLLSKIEQLSNQVLRMTQILLDQHLLRKEVR